jgi:hypothetical protein
MLVAAIMPKASTMAAASNKLERFHHHWKRSSLFSRAISSA